jgi:hypothetical protein
VVLPVRCLPLGDGHKAGDGVIAAFELFCLIVAAMAVVFLVGGNSK